MPVPWLGHPIRWSSSRLKNLFNDSSPLGIGQIMRSKYATSPRREAWVVMKTCIVMSLTNRQPIQRYIAQGRLRWLGHLLRSPPNHPALAIYTFNPRAAGWSRPRGAPRTRWSDVLGKDLKQLGTTLMEASNIALDRSRWRSTIVVRAVSTPSWQEP